LVYRGSFTPSSVRALVRALVLQGGQPLQCGLDFSQLMTFSVISPTPPPFFGIWTTPWASTPSQIRSWELQALQLQ